MGVGISSSFCAEEQAKRIVDDGFKEAETLKKEALLEAKEETKRFQFHGKNPPVKIIAKPRAYA